MVGSSVGVMIDDMLVGYTMQTLDWLLGVQHGLLGGCTAGSSESLGDCKSLCMGPCVCTCAHVCILPDHAIM